MDTHLALWQHEMTRLHRLAPDTVRNRVRVAGIVLELLRDRQGGVLDLASVTRTDLVEVLDARWGASGAASRAVSTAVVRVFFQWLEHAGAIPSSPAAGLRGPRYQSGAPLTFSRDELARLVRATSSRRWPERDRLLVLILATTGMRSSEIMGLRLSDLTRDRAGRVTGAAIVGAKTKRQRWVPFIPQLIPLLEEYLPQRAEQLQKLESSTDLLWASQFGDQRSQGREPGALTDWGLRAVLKDLGKRADVCMKRRAAHAFRHSFATEALESGSHDLRALQEALGHATMETLHVYTRVSRDRLAAAAAAHPLASL